MDVNQKNLQPDLYDILVNAVEDGNVTELLKSRSSSFSQAEAHAECVDLQREDPDAAVLQEPAIPAGYVITNRSVVTYLIRSYFEYLHPYWMVVDKERFMAQFAISNPPPDPLLLVAICAAGAKYSDNAGLSAETGNFPKIGEQFMAHARILLRTRFDTPSIPTVQALLILYWCLVQTGQARLKVIYVGIATRMAQELGLNRPLDAARLDAAEARVVQMRKVIWWSCYQADRWTSATSGRPMFNTQRMLDRIVLADGELS
ncbi:hypothetical protein BGZ68_002016 [Mortierella alpina]|nr:hypothetical protein BGZ68_002016 [Mortierella alpina]